MDIDETVAFFFSLDTVKFIFDVKSVKEKKITVANIRVSDEM